MIAYKFPNGFRTEAEVMFRRLRYNGFTPDWIFENGDMLITVPDDEGSQLRILQRVNPAFWGNAPEGN